jgi:tetratricopeptide (TPR) repeat protein
MIVTCSGCRRMRVALAAVVALGMTGCAAGAPQFEAGARFASDRKWDEALRAYEQAVKEEPGNTQYADALRRARDAAADEQLAKARAAGGSMSQLAEIDRALTSVARALQYNSEHRASLDLQSTLRDRQSALERDIARLLSEGRSAGVRDDWEPAQQAATRVLAIDPSNAEAMKLKQDALRGAVAKSLRLAAQAEGAEDWREAVRHLEQTLALDPANESASRRLAVARTRDNAAYYVGRARDFEGQGQMEAAYRYLKTAAKYYGNEIQDSLERLATEGRRRLYTEALKRAESDDWGRVYNALGLAVEAYGVPPSVHPSVRTIVRELAGKLYDRAMEYENQKLWGNTYLWFLALSQMDSTYRDTANKVEQTREKLLDRATIKIAAFEMESPKAAPDAGSLITANLVTGLSRLRRDFRIIERDALQSIIKEISIGQTGVLDVETAKEIGKIAGIDVILLGRVLEYKVDQNDDVQTKTTTVPLKKTSDNPDYLNWLNNPVRKDREQTAPPRTIETTEIRDYTYKVGTISALGNIKVSFRLVSVERGDVRLAQIADESEAFRQDYSDGVDIARIAAKPRVVPVPTEMLNRATDRVVVKIIGMIAGHFRNRAEAFLREGQEQERRRQFTRAIEEYMNCVTAAELEQTGEPAAAAGRRQIEALMRQ